LLALSVDWSCGAGKRIATAAASMIVWLFSVRGTRWGGGCDGGDERGEEGEGERCTIS